MESEESETCYQSKIIYEPEVAFVDGDSPIQRRNSMSVYQPCRYAEFTGVIRVGMIVRQNS